MTEITKDLKRAMEEILVAAHRLKVAALMSLAKPETFNENVKNIKSELKLIKEILKKHGL